MFSLEMMVDHWTCVHVQCLRNGQCTCTYDLNKTRWLLDGVQVLIRSGSENKALR